MNVAFEEESEMGQIDRRRFVANTAKKVAALSAGAAAMAATRRTRSAQPGDRVRLALIGCGGRGSTVIRRFAKRPDVEVVSLCDLDKREGTSLPKQLNSIQGSTPKRVFHYEEVFTDEGVDAVVIATPDHWHGPLTVFACQAGKDVYVEKPPSHNVWEGRKMVEAARKYKCIVQAGTQNRSAPYVHKAVEYVRSGKLGDIPLCKVFNMKSGGAYKARPNSRQPKEVDWYIWLGPAKVRPYNEGILHGQWHMYWDYSGGDMADDGVHQLDIARWLIGKDFPQSVHCSGGNLAFPNDDREVPDTQIVTYDFDGCIMTFELSQYARYMSKTPNDIRDGDKFPLWMQNATRIELYGTRQMMILGRHGGGWQAFTGDGKVVAQEYGRPGDDPHQEDFIHSVRSRRLPNGDIEEGHRSACLVHLANMSYRLGGRDLVFDAKTETIVGDEEANKLIKREYREPFAIPENV
ncbi:MAG: hypothetical protein AMJ84_05355 [Acidithiobacillales bacterium SM23_46]|nr:MAG: hypothetical protein AMJ84_05355 [Acidithiobacillales bacterium SM23_46]